MRKIWLVSYMAHSIFYDFFFFSSWMLDLAKSKHLCYRRNYEGIQGFYLQWYSSRWQNVWATKKISLNLLCHSNFSLIRYSAVCLGVLCFMQNPELKNYLAFLGAIEFNCEVVIVIEKKKYCVVALSSSMWTLYNFRSERRKSIVALTLACRKIIKRDINRNSKSCERGGKETGEGTIRKIASKCSVAESQEKQSKQTCSAASLTFSSKRCLPLFPPLRFFNSTSCHQETKTPERASPLLNDWDLLIHVLLHDFPQSLVSGSQNVSKPMMDPKKRMLPVNWWTV